MAMHVEKHDVDGKEQILLVTDAGMVLATFVSEEAVTVFTKEKSLSWVFAHQTGLTGI